MPVDVAEKKEKMLAGMRAVNTLILDLPVHNPWARIISPESDSDIVASSTNADHISLNGINIIIYATSSTANDIEGMLHCH